MAHDKQRQSLYFPDDMLEEIRHEARRQDRTLSWIVQKAWEIAKGTLSLSLRFRGQNDP